MKCEKCRAVYPEEYNFCPNCGKILIDEFVEEIVTAIDEQDWMLCIDHI